MIPKSKFLFILKIFALSPSSNNPNTERALSALSLITILTIVLCAISGFTIDIFGDGFIVSSFATSVVYLCLTAGHIIAILESLVKREYHEQFFAKLYELDDVFRFKLGHKIPIKEQRKKLIQKYGALAFAVYLSMFIYISSILTHDYKGFFWLGSFSVIVSRMRFIQVSVYVDLVCLRFDHLNVLLKQIASCRMQQIQRMLDFDYYAIDNPERILVFKMAYTKLQDIVDCLNEAFGWSILIFTLYCSVDITCNGYWIILTWENYLESYHNYECFSTIIPLALVMSFFCYICSELVRKNDTTKHLVQRMLSTTPNDHTNYLLDAFLLQISNQPIFIHAKMFFRVNLKLLSSICASMLGYLVILIQFRFTEDEL